jgi:hypothetical protein
VGRVGVLVLVVAAAAVAAAVAFAAPSPQQWRAAMLAAVSARHSVHYVTTSSVGGRTFRMVADVGRGRGIQRIAVTSDGHSGPATILIAGRTAYIKGNAFTMHNFFAFTQAQAGKYAGKWISIPSTNSGYPEIAADATFASFSSDLVPAKGLSLVRATIGGKKAVGVRGTAQQGGVKLVETVYAPATGVPLPFEQKAVPVGAPGTAVTRMSRWNEAVHVTAPAHAVPVATVVGH